MRLPAASYPRKMRRSHLFGPRFVLPPGLRGSGFFGLSGFALSVGSLSISLTRRHVFGVFFLGHWWLSSQRRHSFCHRPVPFSRVNPTLWRTSVAFAHLESISAPLRAP